MLSSNCPSNPVCSSRNALLMQTMSSRSSAEITPSRNFRSAKRICTCGAGRKKRGGRGGRRGFVTRERERERERGGESSPLILYYTFCCVNCVCVCACLFDPNVCDISVCDAYRVAGIDNGFICFIRDCAFRQKPRCLLDMY